MNSSAQPCRRIASNRLWTPRGIVRDPLVEVAEGGRILSVRSCGEPDRPPATEFYAGLLVPGFPSDCRAVFERLRAASASLSDQLPGLVRSDGVLVVISGLDYDTLRLTAQSRIRRL